MIRNKETQAWRDQQADAIDRDPTLECSDEQCGNTTNLTDANGWLLCNDPDIPMLCPNCVAKPSENSQTPTEHQRDVNAQLTKCKNE